MCLRLPILFVVVLAAGPLVAAPRLKPERPKTPSLIGTTWSGNTFEMKTMVLEFQADGQVNVTYNGNRVDHCGWSQEGEAVHVEINSAYLKFDGKFKEGRIVGRCHNVAGSEWDATLTPVRKD